MSIKSKAAQDFVPIKEIRNEIIILKDGTMRMVLMASSINLALKSEDEQMAILMQFRSFLNSLEFSTQIFIQSRRLDIRPYLALLEGRLHEELNELLKIQIREYTGFIKKIAESNNIMSKMFLVIVPYAPPKSVTASASGGGILGFLRKKGVGPEATKGAFEHFEEARSQLEQRAGIIGQGLARTGVRVVPLGAEELTELYYRLFNPGATDKPVAAE